MKRLLLAITLSVASLASFGCDTVYAQGGITSYIMRVYAPGTNTVISTQNIPIGNIVCNQDVPSNANNPVNPEQAIWIDPANLGKFCLWQDPGTGPLRSLTGAFEMTLTAVNSVGTGAESDRAPFSRGGVPAKPLGLRFSKSF